MIEKRPFGRTGHMSSATLFGAASLGRISQDEAERALDLGLEYGINHIDTAASYGDAELRLGPWLAKGNRQHVFLATKTGERTYEAAEMEIQRSLERMQVDQVDLIQLHNLGHPDEWDTATSAGGALQAAIDARQQGLVRFIGVTGHGLNIVSMHKRSLARFDFDSVLFPYNYVLSKNSSYMADVESLIALCQERNVAIQTIKSIARGPWGTTVQNYNTWYQPLEEQTDLDLAVHWVLGRPGVFLNTVGDVTLLPKVLDAADRLAGRPSDEQMESMLAGRQMTSMFA